MLLEPVSRSSKSSASTLGYFNSTPASIKETDLEPNIIVKFINCTARDMVFRARGQLKNLPITGKIFINEDLSKDTAQLLRQARSMVKAKSLHVA